MRAFLVACVLAGSAAAATVPSRILVAPTTALVEAWASAQTRGDVAAYLAFYDPLHFHGVKRTQRGATRYDHAGWAAERRKMVANRPTVTATGITVESWLDPGSKLKPNIVRARFTQRWKSARYADHGVKVLDLVFDPKDRTLKIVYEDLLNSAPGFDDASPGAPIELGEIGDEAAAARAWTKLALTSGDVDAKLAALPDAPQVRRLMARALVKGGRFECKRVVEVHECGQDLTEWETLPSDLPFSDPCVRRRALLWAMRPGALGDRDVEGAPLFLELLGWKEPGDELPKAVMELSKTLSDPLRLRFLEAAIAADREALAEGATGGLGPTARVDAARLHLDSAAAALDGARQRAAVIDALGDDKLERETRVALVEKLRGQKGAEVDAGLRKAARTSDCAVSMLAADLLASRGDRSALPARPANATVDQLARELCRLKHEPDAERAEKVWKTFLPPRGKVKLTSEIDDEWDRNDDGERIQRKQPVSTIERATSTLHDLSDEVGNGDGPACTDDDCQAQTTSGHYDLSWKRARDGQLYLSRLHTYEWRGCGC